MEPDVFELADGRVGMIMRTQARHIAVAVPEDGGDTWGMPLAWAMKGSRRASHSAAHPDDGRFAARLEQYLSRGVLVTAARARR